MGANPHAKVDKLEFYRKLDEHRQLLVRISEQRGGLEEADEIVAEATGANQDNAQMIDTSVGLGP